MAMSLTPGLANIFTTIGRANGPRKCDLRARTRDKRQVGAQGPGLVAVDSWVTNFGLLRRRRGGGEDWPGKDRANFPVGDPQTRPKTKPTGDKNTPQPGHEAPTQSRSDHMWMTGWTGVFQSESEPALKADTNRSLSLANSDK